MSTLPMLLDLQATGVEFISAVRQPAAHPDPPPVPHLADTVDACECDVRLVCCCSGCCCCDRMSDSRSESVRASAGATTLRLDGATSSPVAVARSATPKRALPDLCRGNGGRGARGESSSPPPTAKLPPAADAGLSRLSESELLTRDIPIPAMPTPAAAPRRRGVGTGGAEAAEDDGGVDERSTDTDAAATGLTANPPLETPEMAAEEAAPRVPPTAVAGDATSSEQESSDASPAANARAWPSPPSAPATCESSSDRDDRFLEDSAKSRGEGAGGATGAGASRKKTMRRARVDWSGAGTTSEGGFSARPLNVSTVAAAAKDALADLEADSRGATTPVLSLGTGAPSCWWMMTRRPLGAMVNLDADGSPDSPGRVASGSTSAGACESPRARLPLSSPPKWGPALQVH